MKIAVESRQLVIQGHRPDEDRQMEKLVRDLEKAQIGHALSVRPKRLTVRVHMAQPQRKPREAVEIYDGMH